MKRILLMTLLFASCTSTVNEISEDYDSALESTTSTTSSSTTSTTTTTIPKNRLQLLAYESDGENGKEYLVTGTYGTKDVYITGQDELLIGYTNSYRSKEILEDFDKFESRFWLISPKAISVKDLLKATTASAA